MIHLDAITIIFSHFLSNLLITIIMVLLWRNYAQRFPGLNHWLIYYVLHTSGLGLLLLYEKVPDIIPIFGGLSLIIIGFMVFYFGFALFFQKKINPYLNYSMTAVFIILEALFLLVKPFPAGRSILFNFMIAVISFQCLWLLLFRLDEKQKRFARFTGWIFVLYFMISITQLLYILLFYQDIELPEKYMVSMILITLYQMLGIAMSFSLFLMINGMLFDDIKTFSNEREDLLEELKLLATTDALTGVSNRLRLERVLFQEMNRSRRYGHPFSVILIDVDHFKQVNDEYGHHIGDIVLKEVSDIIARSVREVDTPGRWGGEEFLIICPETDIAGALVLAEKVRAKVENYTFDTVSHKTVSMGVAQLKKDEGEDAMMNRADAALYRAKNNGRNRVESGDS